MSSPKQLQRKKKFQEALRIYALSYTRALQEGDRYLCGLILDEVANSIAYSSNGQKPDLNMDTLKSRIYESIVEEAKKNLDPEAIIDIEEDLEIQMRKRFPKQYEEDE